MALDTTTFAAALKLYYTPERVENMVYKDNPFLAMVPKSSKFPGTSVEVPIYYEDSQNRSATFASAQANTSDLSIGKFSVTPANDYGIAVISNEIIRASQSQEGAFMPGAKAAVNAVINGLRRSLAQKLMRGGWGTIGRINATAPTTLITLSQASDVVNFGRNQRLVFAAAEDTGALRSATHVTVTAVDRTAGTLTVTPDASTLAAAANDFIFAIGDRQNSATPARIAVTGVGGYVPQAAPGSAAFFGLDRSPDVTRLGGLRQDSRAQRLEEALIDAAELVGREGWALSHFFMNFTRYGSLLKELGSKVQYVDIETDIPHVAFQGVRVIGPRGPVTVVPDHNCPADTIFGLTLDTWLYRSRGEPISVLDDGDGLPMLRSATADTHEIRWGGYGNLTCSAPGANINVRVG